MCDEVEVVGMWRLCGGVVVNECVTLVETVISVACLGLFAKQSCKDFKLESLKITQKRQIRHKSKVILCKTLHVSFKSFFF